MFMNGAFLHLVLNHIPVLVPVVGIAVILAGLILNLRQVQTVGLTLIIFGALAAIPTYFTGESAKKIVQNYPQITNDSIERHSQAALYALVAIEIVGALALMLLCGIWRGHEISRQNLLALLALAVVASFLVGRTAHLGGLIHHDEIEQGLF
jgi:uncharacterized membrane protein